MTDDSNNGIGRTPPDAKVLGLLEKAGEFKWMLAIAATTLYVDCALMVHAHKNLLTLDWPKFNWTAALGTLAVAALFFSILISAVLPFLEFFFANAVRLAYYQWIWTPDSDQVGRLWRPRNMVKYHELKEHADRTQSQYVLAKCKEWDEKNRKSAEEAAQLGSVAFRALWFLIANLILSLKYGPAAIFSLAGSMESDALRATILAVAGILCWISCVSWCRDPKPDKWIAYAPLYDELHAAEERQREAYEK
ncbi:hypothetical protein [Pseudoduganella violaceinigra]|uniref:hypothetical protein n=1 Tax=Pseudoduganella violaceinigra TaxID=246602 RepID=UPI0004891BD5|nr:hypothetical protein [Pseudoduganella violaceinigra]